MKKRIKKSEKNKNKTPAMLLQSRFFFSTNPSHQHHLPMASSSSS